MRLTAQPDHPHILPLLDSGEADGLLCYAMPFVEGPIAPATEMAGALNLRYSIHTATISCMARTRPTTSALREPLAYALATPAKVAALRVLTGAGAPLTQREVARRAGVQHRAVQRALNEMVPLGIVTRWEGGRDYLVRLSDHHRLAAPLRVLFAAEAEHFLDLRRNLAEAARRMARRTGLVTLALFGSVARARDGVESDCDLLVVARDQRGLDAALVGLASVARTLEGSHGCYLRPIGYTLEDAAARWRSRDAPFPGIRRDGLVVFGPPLEDTLRG